MRRIILAALTLLSLSCAQLLIRDSRAKLSARSEVPMRLLQDVPAVQVMIPGLGMRWFLVDTGAPISVISSALEDKVAHSESKIPIVMEGSNGEKVNARSLYIDELLLGGVTLTRLFAVSVDLSSIEQRAGVELGGVLGFSAFEDLLLTLDYPEETLILERGELPAPDQREIFRYQKESEHPALPATLEGQAITLVLDSGSRDYLSIPESKQAQFTYQSDPVQIGTSLSIAQSAPCYAARLSSPLLVAGHSIPAPQATFAPIDTFLAGGKFLRVFSITFDQKNKRLRLRPPQKFSLEQPSIRSLGAELCKKNNVWEVCSALDGQLLRPEDQLISVAGKATAAFDISDWQDLIQSSQSLELTILREGAELTVSVLIQVLVP